MSTEQPLVSIITVVYNGAKTLEQTIAGVLGQTYPNIEYLVLDGGSTDGSIDIIRRHEKSISWWASQADAGMYFAMNAGIARSRGALVGIINSDDWYEPDAVDTVVREYLATDRQTVLYGITRYYDERGLDMILSYDHSRLPWKMINHPACFIPRTVYDRFGAFDTRYRVAADYELVVRLNRRGAPFKHVERIIANFRHGGFSQHNKSAAEALRIQLENGYITRRQYLIGTGVRMAKSVIGRMKR